jgi:hypothetical protein
MRDALEEALRRGQLLDVEGVNGEAWSINPSQVLYVEEANGASQNGAVRVGGRVPTRSDP